MKCAYIHKDDWIENPKDRKQVRFTWFPFSSVRYLLATRLVCECSSINSQIRYYPELCSIRCTFQSTCPVRLVNFAREDIHRSFDYLKERIFIRRKSPDDRPVIYTTGIGGSQYMKQIKDEFRVE